MAQVGSRQLLTAKTRVEIRRSVVQKVAMGQVFVRLSVGFLCQYRLCQCYILTPEIETADSSGRKLTSLPKHGVTTCKT